jgi:hypothetical protein
VRFACALVLASACGDTNRPHTFGGFDAAPDLDAGLADAGGDSAPDLDAGDPPLPEPDIELVLPFGAPPEVVDLEYTAAVRLLDLHLSVDTTSSMFEEIDAIQAELQTTVAAGVDEAVDDVTFGVSEFEDFPFDPFGGADDRPFTLLEAQGSLAQAQAAVRRLDDPLGFGGDFPESTAEALYQIATGEGFAVQGETLVEPHLPGPGELGGVSFRPGALPVVVVATDERSHTPSDYAATFDGAHSLAEATDALVAIGARVVGIATGEHARVTLVPAAIATGGVAPPTDGLCATGVDGAEVDPVDGVCPLVFDVNADGSGLSDAVVDAIRTLVESIVWRTVAIRIVDDDLGFVFRAEALSSDAPDGSPEPGLADLDPTDGVNETFTDVYRGTRLVYRMSAENAIVEPTDYDQIFYLESQLVGDGDTIVDEKLIRVRVPAR